MNLKTAFYITFFSFFFINSQAQTDKDSLWAIWQDETRTAINRLEALKAIDSDDENQRFNPKNLDSGYMRAKLMYEFAKKRGIKKWLAEGLNIQGTYFHMKKDYDEAAVYVKQALKIAEELDDKLRIAKYSYNLGMGFLKQADFAQSIPLFTRASNLFEELGDKRLQAHALDKIYMLYFQQKDEKCIIYLNQALKIREELLKEDDNPKDRYVVVMMKKSLAAINEAIGIKDTISDDGQDAQKIIEDLGLEEDSSMALSLTGQDLLEQGEFDEAEKRFNQSIKKSESEGEPLKVMGFVQQAGGLYFEKKEYAKALPYFKKALVISQKEKVLHATGTIYHYLYETYKNLGQHRQALDMFQNSITIRDSIINMANAKAIIQQNVQSDYDKQKAIDDIENEKEVAIEAQKTKAQQRISWAIGIGLLSISILALVIFNRLKITRQQKVIIEEQKKKVEQSEKYKQQFLANMSHEIRTPMHAISGMTKILERNEHPTSQNVFLKAMKTSSDNLVVILNDVLDLSKIEAGKLEIEHISMNPILVIENVVQILKYKAEEKGLELSFTVSDEVPTPVMGDPTRLNQILINLVGNAIKFTEKGHVKIALNKRAEQLQFSVNDTGIGIPKDKLEHIFGAFEQAKGSTSRYYGGTGLGLSISKQLVELQDGKIWAESTEGQGSVFLVELPLNIPEANAISKKIISKENLKAMAASLKGIRILIAEDNPFNQMIAQDDLSYYLEDVTIDVVENGALAIDKFKTQNFDLILMDVQMPILNGFEATKKIRDIELSEERKIKIPIIAMTASLLKTEINSCYDAGMNNYIPKPYKLDELIVPIFNELRS